MKHGVTPCQHVSLLYKTQTAETCTRDKPWVSSVWNGGIEMATAFHTDYYRWGCRLCVHVRSWVSKFSIHILACGSPNDCEADGPFKLLIHKPIKQHWGSLMAFGCRSPQYFSFGLMDEAAVIACVSLHACERREGGLDLRARCLHCVSAPCELAGSASASLL